MAKDEKPQVTISTAPIKESSKSDINDEELDRLTDPNPAPVILENRNKDRDRMVKIRPRKTVGRTFIGGQSYQINENKEMIVPKHVADLLQEKGIC